MKQQSFYLLLFFLWLWRLQPVKMGMVQSTPCKWAKFRWVAGFIISVLQALSLSRFLTWENSRMLESEFWLLDFTTCLSPCHRPGLFSLSQVGFVTGCFTCLRGAVGPCHSARTTGGWCSISQTPVQRSDDFTELWLGLWRAEGAPWDLVVSSCSHTEIWSFILP